VVEENQAQVKVHLVILKLVLHIRMIGMLEVIEVVQVFRVHHEVVEEHVLEHVVVEQEHRREVAQLEQEHKREQYIVEGTTEHK
jgi:hypothetical protein